MQDRVYQTDAGTWREQGHSRIYLTRDQAERGALYRSACEEALAGLEAYALDEYGLDAIEDTAGMFLHDLTGQPVDGTLLHRIAREVYR